MMRKLRGDVDDEAVSTEWLGAGGWGLGAGTSGSGRSTDSEFRIPNSEFPVALARPFRRPLISALAITTLCLSGCFGYHVGNHTLLPQTISTVSVQMFRSDSFRRNIGEQLTEAVAKEIERRTPYKVVDSTEADATLAGRVVSATKQGVTETRNDDLREIEYNLYVLVEWRVHGSDMVRQGELVAVPSSLLEFNRASSLVPEIGQSIATAQQKAIRRLARQIVDQLETPWYAERHVQ